MANLIATRAQRGMAVFLCSDLVVFLALFSSYIYLRVESATWPAAFHFASGLMAFAIANFALAGSFAIFFARRYQLNQGFDISRRLLLATVAVLGCAVILLGMEWVRLIFIAGVTFTTNPWGVPAFSWTYFALTGFFAMHLLAGLIYVSIVGANVRTSDAGSAALFVHFTNLVWLVLLFGVYFASTDLQGL